MAEVETYTPELAKKYLNKLVLEYPNKDRHFLEIAVLQYLLLDCDKDYKPSDKNEDYNRAKELYKQHEIKAVQLEGEYEPFLNDNCNEDKNL